MIPRRHLRLVTASDPPGEHRVVVFRGALDIAAAPAFTAALAQVHGEPLTHLIVDLRGVHFADSTALAILLTATRRRTAAGCTLITVCEPGPVLRLMQLTALTQTLNVVPTLPAAHARIAAAAPGPS